MSQHSSLKRPGSSSGKREQRISWGPENIHEFSKDLSPSSRNLINDPYQASPSNAKHLTSPSAPNPVTPIHYNLHQTGLELSPVLEEEHRSDFSQDSPFDSQKSMNSLFPETEPFNMPSLNWSLPSSNRNLIKTPKKNSQTQKILLECRENLEKKRQEHKNMSAILSEYQENINKTNSFLSDFIQKKAELLNKIYSNTENSQKSFQESCQVFQKFNLTPILELPPLEHWKKLSQDGNYMHKANIISNQMLSNLIITHKNSLLSLEVQEDFNEKYLNMIWQEYNSFIKSQQYPDMQTMLRTISDLWHHFIKFCESFQELKLISVIQGVQFTQDSCIVVGECLNEPWKVTINFFNIHKDWDIFSLVQEYFQLNY